MAEAERGPAQASSLEARDLDALGHSLEGVAGQRDPVRLILESVADPIVVVDASGKPLYLNPPARRLVRGESRQSEPTPVQAANREKLQAFLTQVGLNHAGGQAAEIQLTDPETGDALTMTVRASEIKDGAGRQSATVAVLHDVTGIRELERRTLEQQLFESEKLAAIGRLAAAVAHEINNPLEAIKNALYLLVQQTPRDDPNRRFLEIASKETQRVSNVIRQMLGFARPPAAAEPVDINHLIDDVCALLDRQLRQSRIRLHRELDPRLPSVRGSAEELSQVFLNLVINAQHAMPSGGNLYVTSRVAGPTDAEFVSGSFILVQVRDTGVGIPEDQLPRIFEPFYTTKSRAKGTGLGLWVTRGIVQNHGGQMHVRSQVGEGTTFTIALPVAPAA